MVLPERSLTKICWVGACDCMEVVEDVEALDDERDGRMMGARSMTIVAKKALLKMEIARWEGCCVERKVFVRWCMLMFGKLCVKLEMSQ